MRSFLMVVCLGPMCFALLGGCSSIGDVASWQKGNLAKRSMSITMDPLDEKFTLHVYLSKENTSGGYGVGGGGCGCN
jgi:hypothetical protein